MQAVEKPNGFLMFCTCQENRYSASIFYFIYTYTYNITLILPLYI